MHARCFFYLVCEVICNYVIVVIYHDVIMCAIIITMLSMTKSFLALVLQVCGYP